MTDSHHSKDPRRWTATILRTLPATVAIAALVTPLVMPHPTRPQILPMPQVDRAHLEKLDQRERAEATVAQQTALPHEIRVVGELFRRVGTASIERQTPVRPLLVELRKETALLLEAGRSSELLRLRALQSQLFVEAVHDWVVTKEASADLHELGGDFARQAQASWLSEEQEMQLTDRELRLLFRVRWGRLADTHRQPPFGPSIDELRDYYGIYLRHPEGSQGSAPASIATAQLRYVKALAKIDPDYPAGYASGVLLSRAGEPEMAGVELKGFLANRQSGPWALSARNLLLHVSRSP